MPAGSCKSMQYSIMQILEGGRVVQVVKRLITWYKSFPYAARIQEGFRTHHIKRMYAFGQELHLWLNFTANEVIHTHVCVFPDQYVYCVYTCRSNMCAPEIFRLCLCVSSLTSWKKKASKYVSLWKSCSSEGKIMLLHEQFWKCSVLKTVVLSNPGWSAVSLYRSAWTDSELWRAAV